MVAFTSTSDAEIVRRLRDHDASALDEAYARHAARCKAVARRVLGDDAAAEDATQEAFFALWRHRCGLVVRAAGVGPWLVVATRNAALNIARGARRRSAREAADARDAGDPSDPTEIALERIAAADLRAAVQTLPQEQKVVIAHAYFARRTLAEIARLTGAPLGTIKRRAQLALSRLAQVMEGEAR